MKLSVVMATYNGEKYLKQQIESILTQTLKPDEIIVCDDVSTDGTVSILNQYYQQGKLTYVVNDHRLGFIDNFKKAVALAADTNYVSLSDQDDEWLPDKLEKSVALLQKIDDSNIPCLVYTDLMWIDQDQKILNGSFLNVVGQDKYQHNLQTLLFGNLVTGCTTLINPALKRLFAEIPNDIYFHDAWMALMAFTFGKAECVRLPLVKYRKHENNASMSVDAKTRNRYRSMMNEILKYLKGKDDFIAAQLETAHKFYERYYNEMTPDIRQHFEQFLTLKNKNYFLKKLAYRRVVRKFSVKF